MLPDAGDAGAGRPHQRAVSAPSLRIVSAGVEESLERFSDPALLSDGKVNVISLEAVQKAFGERWELRRDQVYDFARRTLERGVGDNGVFLRVSPTDFFIVHPELSRLGGQAACLRYLREVLEHFLGESHMAASGVLQVTKITHGRLEAEQMDARVTDGGPDDVDVHDPITPPKPAPAGSCPGRWCSSPAVASPLA